MKAIRITIPLPEKVSLNNFYASRHWSLRQKIVDMYHEAVFFSVKQQKIRPVKQYPVFITYAFTLKGRLLDASNCPVKLIEDGLVTSGILIDDSPRYVKGYSVLSVEKGKENVVTVDIQEG